jgi:polyisoprenyl-teichoic acid--peptidoglycan teichoic acid transferase
MLEESKESSVRKVNLTINRHDSVIALTYFSVTIISNVFLEDHYMKWLKITGYTLLLLIVAVGVYGFTVYQSFNHALKNMHQPLKNANSQAVLAEKEPFSVLMLGIDERDGDKGRSDTMIVLTVNPDNESIKMLSIPRDTRTEIIGLGKEDKINHAYAFGGVQMAMDTVEAFLDIPIDYYVQVNMEGFKEIVDAVGGITVNNTLDFTVGEVEFPIGELRLDGEQALSFSRMRYDDPNGDFGRQARQRQMIQAVIKEGASLSSLVNVTDILSALGSNVKTNLTLDQMVALQKNYKHTGKNIEQLVLHSEGKIIDKIYYGLVTQAEQQRIQDEMKNQLGVKEKN